MILPPDAAAKLRELIAEANWDDAWSDDPTAMEASARLFAMGFHAGYEAGFSPGPMARAKELPTWRSFCQELLASGDLTDWEDNFVRGFIDRGYREPTYKQKAVFEKIADKLELACPQ
jgi:hypothetical protein